uniref:Uncharacterized protein n=1 Tax=viral metagenome TaxID=1070528 RepID=A0A6C0E6B2_9ZZZZ
MATMTREQGGNKKVLLDELIEKYNAAYRVCDNCSNVCDDDNVVKRYILFRRYRFCSDWCSYDTEYDVRKDFSRLTKEHQDRRIAINKRFGQKLPITRNIA